MDLTNLTPFYDGKVYRNFLWDHLIQRMRPIEFFEAQVVAYCIPERHHLNAACARISHADAKGLFFRLDDLFEAGRAIFDYESKNDGYQSALVVDLMKTLSIVYK